MNAASKQCDGERTFAVASVERLIEVGLLGLGGQARGGASALHVDYDQGQLRHHGKSHGLGLEREAGSRSRCHRKAAGERRTYRGADSGDFILRLEGLGPEALVNGELLENTRSRGYRI